PRRLPGVRFNLSDDVFFIIRKKIMTREIRPGDRMNIDSLSRDLNVSQTPIREALARLEATGLVIKEPLKGFRASQLLNQKAAQDLFTFRSVLEPYAAKIAAEYSTKEQIEQMYREIDFAKEIQNLSGIEAFEKLAEHDETIHTQIFEAAGNVLLAKAYKASHCFLHLYRLHFIRDVPVDFEETMTEHTAIISALEMGDSHEAFSAMTQHIDNARNRFQYPAI
ncbi:MAG: GntR family transcriptional regulator, partial [Candidatus Nanopelagicales bacterium]